MAVDSIARGMVAEAKNELNNKIEQVEANKAYVFEDYQSMIENLNSAAKKKYKLGNNIFVKTENVPDLWVSGISDTKETYIYTTDAQVIQDIENETFQAGYIQLTALETKVLIGASYNDLLDKPRINNIELIGNKTSENLQLIDRTNPTGTGKLQINGEAKGIKSVAIGDKTTAYGGNSVAEGRSDHFASDIVTDQEIADVVVAANKSSRTNEDLETITEFIETWDHIPDGEEDPDQKFSLAGGDFSSVKGANGLALAKGAEVEGNGTVAAGKSSHAEGTGSKAIGHYAHAGGLETMANTYGSFVHGRESVANRRYSAVFGRGTKDADSYSETEANGLGALVFGKYNEPDSNAVLMAGAGSDGDHRKTVHEVFKDGDKFKSWTEDDVTCGGGIGAPLRSLVHTMKATGDGGQGNKLSTVNAVNSCFESGAYQVYLDSGQILGSGCPLRFGEMLVVRWLNGSNEDFGAQIIFPNGDDDADKKNCFWYRTCSTGAWNSWIQVDPSKYQEKLVSGTNVKTIGDQDILGSGNIAFKTIDGTSVIGSGNIAFKAINGTSVIGSGNITVTGIEELNSIIAYGNQLLTGYSYNRLYIDSYGYISDNKGQVGATVLPYYYNGKTVYGVAERGFVESSITHLILPNTMIGINAEGFQSCFNLVDVKLSDRLTEIGSSAFAYCTALTSIELPESLTTLGDTVFSGCTALTSVVIPDSVTTFGTNVFLNCPNVIVYCNAGSDAEQYCIDNSINYTTIYGDHIPKDFTWQQGDVIGNKNGTIHKLSEKQNIQATVSQSEPSTITLADNTTYYLSSVSDLTLTYPQDTHWECLLQVETASSGAVTITLPNTTKFIGDVPTFDNNEVWEISIRDGIVVCGKAVSAS